MIRVRVLYRDLIGRFAEGEEGILLENDYEDKYKYRVQFPQGKYPYPRILYFFEDEIEVIEDE